MRVLFVVDSVEAGGAEFEVLGLATELLNRQQTVAVAFFTDGRLRCRFEALAIPLHRISWAGLSDPLALPRLMLTIWRFRPDVVHTHLAKSDALGLIAAWLLRVPVRLSTLHNASPWRQSAVLSLASRLIVASAHQVIAVSPSVRDHAHRFSRLPLSKMLVIPNTVDWRRFATDRSGQCTSRPPDAQPVVGMVGRLTAQKGHDTFLRAAAVVSAQRQDVTFTIVGDGELRDVLVEQTRSLGLTSRVRFAGFSDDVTGVMRGFTILAMPSRYEGLPRVLLEGMAGGLPIVASRASGILDVVTPGEDALLVAPGDPHALASGILELLDNPDRARVLGENARRKVGHHYDPTEVHGRIVDLYASLLRTR